MFDAAVSIAFDGVAYAMILFTISVGLSLTMGLMGFVNLAHGAFAMAGGYVTVSVMAAMGLPFAGALLVAMIVVGVASLPIERLLYARLYRASELDQVLLSIGLVFIAVGAFAFFYGPEPQAVILPDALTGRITVGARDFPVYRTLIIAIGVALFAVLWLGFERTVLGARTRAAVDNRAMARSVGIDVDRLFTLTFAAGSALAALGGGLAVEVIGLSPTFAVQYLVLFLIVIAVGGAGSITGTFVAALALGVIDTAGKYLWPDGGAFFIYAATVVLLLVRPGGLYGRS